MRTNPITETELQQYMATENALDGVRGERVRQVEKWGRQSHPDGTLEPDGRADKMRERCETAFQNNQGTWAHILLEEVFEAIEAENPDHLVEELTQVAAVCVSWVEDIRRRG